jgi:hypothetical protein
MTTHGELESRYRRLMALYPGWHRREYEDELIGVLLADAEPGRRRPGLRDRADLVAGALAVRLRSIGGAARGQAWRDAAFLAQVVGAMLLLAVGVRRLAYVFFGMDLTALEVARPAGWALVLIAALAGARRAAAGLAVAAAAVEILHVARWYPESPTQTLQAAWLVTTALLLVAVSGRLATGPVPARPRRLWWFAGALVAAVAANVADLLQGSYFAGSWEWAVTMNGEFVFRFAAVLYVVAAGAAVRGWWRQERAVRRRLVAFAAPVAAVAAVVLYGFAGYRYSSSRFDSPIMLVPLQWAVLAVTPLLAFAVAVTALGRWERLSHLVELGRRAEAASLPPDRVA